MQLARVLGWIKAWVKTCCFCLQLTLNCHLGDSFHFSYFRTHSLKMYRDPGLNSPEQILFIHGANPKSTPFPLTWSIIAHRRTLVLLPCLMPCNRREKFARESCNSHYLITQRDNIHVRTHNTCVGQPRYGAAHFVLKIEKLSHIIVARESQALRSASPIMALVIIYTLAYIDFPKISWR